MITHVAVRFRGTTYSLPAPNRHHHVIRKIADETGAQFIDAHGDDQGFLNDAGCYLTRNQALAHALECNQVKDPGKVVHDMLFSEDVW